MDKAPRVQLWLLLAVITVGYGVALSAIFLARHLL